MEPFIIWEEGIPVHIVLLLCVRVCVGGGGGGWGRKKAGFNAFT